MFKNLILVTLFDMILNPNFKMMNHFNLLVVRCHRYSLKLLVFGRFAKTFMPIYDKALMIYEYGNIGIRFFHIKLKIVFS